MYTSVSFEVDEAKLGCELSGCHQPFFQYYHSFLMQVQKRSICATMAGPLLEKQVE
jgi:hypothetical protein